MESIKRDAEAFLAKTEGAPERITEQRETAKSLLLKIAAVRAKLNEREAGN